jgi:chromosome segregation ATPase
MIRLLQFINLAGVLAMAILCSAQWRENRRLNLDLQRLQAQQLQLEKKLEERDQVIGGHVRDLDHLRNHLTRITGELKEAEGRIALAERDAFQAGAERDALKSAAQEWEQAIRDRDEQLRETHSQLQELAGRLSEAAMKYNELATNYNALVQELNRRSELVNRANGASRP